MYSFTEMCPVGVELFHAEGRIHKKTDRHGEGNNRFSQFCKKAPKNKGERGSTVVKALCYKSEGRWFDSRWCHWNFSLT